MASELESLLVKLNITNLQKRDQPLYDFLSHLLRGTSNLAKAVAVLNSSSGGSVTNQTIIQQFLNFSDSGADGDSLVIPGPSGATGAAGSAGVAGVMGPPGLAGEDGSDGLDGFPGARGADGTSGSTGAVGPIGPAIYLADDYYPEDPLPIPGPIGPTGATGATGATGGMSASPVDLTDWTAEDEIPVNLPISLPFGEPILVTYNQAVASNLGWVIPENLEIASGITLEVPSDARVEVTGPVPAVGMFFIQRIVAAGSQTTIDFTSIPSIYTTLKVFWFGQDTATGTSASVLRLMVNNDNTAGNYSSSFRNGSANAVAVVSSQAASAKGVQVGSLVNSGNTNQVAAGEVTLPGYTAPFFKEINTQFGGFPATGGGQVFIMNAEWNNVTPINRLTFGTDGTAFTNGATFSLHGIL